MESEKIGILKRQMGISKIREQGITLVALVVTIIIMLILAGVTLNIAISDNGIFSKAKKAVKEYQIASEREYLEQNVLSVQLDKYLQNVSSEKLGKSLVDRNLENSSIWDIIVEKSENKTYGTGWNYLGKGTVLEDYGETKYNWVVNYETGEIIQLEDESYNNFDYNSTISVTDHLLFNLDSANVGLDKASWGSNATLYYYDDQKYNTEELRKKAYNEQKDKNVTTDNNGYDRQQATDEEINKYIDETTGAFEFNGNNYIEIYDTNGYDFSKGLTFEFYGNISGNVAATVTEGQDKYQNKWCGLFGLWNGQHNSQCLTRFGSIVSDKWIMYSLRAWGDVNINEGGLSYPASPWNQRVAADDILNKDIYITITIDNTKNYNNEEDKITQSIYIYKDGKAYENESWLLKSYYDDFIKRVKNLNYLELGRCTFGNESNWGYIKGLCYSTRIYNKGLTKGEIEENHKVTTDFHKYIIDSKNNK